MKYWILMAAMMISFSAHAGSDLLGMYKGYTGDSQTALTSPHRGIGELGTWLSDKVADDLQFSSGRATAKLTIIKADFSDAGYQSYLKFLNDMNFTFALRNQSLNLSSIVTSAPVLIGQGASRGRYAWLYEMPVVLTMGGQQPVSKETTIRVQLGRSAKATNDMGVLIESFSEYKDPNAAPGTDNGGGEESSGQN